MKNLRHFVNLHDLSCAELHALIRRAIEFKQHRDPAFQPLKGQVLAMIFEKSSTRTRISFEAGMAQLGGSAIFLSAKDTQLGRGEPLTDSAKVISSMVDCIMLRTYDHATVTTFAQHSRVPVINGLTDLSHPCQVLADMQTFFEYRGDIAGKTVTWIGAGNNMCHSYIDAAMCLNFKLNIACPVGYAPAQQWLDFADQRVRLFTDPHQAAENSDLLVTDVWTSMGEEQQQQQRVRDFKHYQVSQAVMDCANKEALFMHCLPAHRGEEVTAEVIDGKQSVVFAEAENRLHIQKALLEFLMCR